MGQTGSVRTVGVEEEYLLADAGLERLLPVASSVLSAAAGAAEVGTRGGAGAGALVHEFQEQQLEVYTSPHLSMPLLEAELRGWRARAQSAAEQAGARLVASGTSPVPVQPCHVHTQRYDRIAERFGVISTDMLTCGCHVHVAVGSTEEAVGVLDRIRVWLPVLLALSANSPFWKGRDTRYASYRSQALGAWPVSGPTEVFGSAGRYREVVAGIVAAGVVLDEGMVYFDARRSHRHQTVEIRMPDVCLDVRDAVLVAALARGLVETSSQEWTAGRPPPTTSVVLLRLATWHAARWGVEERLVDPLSGRLAPAQDVVLQLLDHVLPALRLSGDAALVTEGIERIRARGNGAMRQRDVMRRTGRLTDVLASLAEGTLER